MKSNGLYKFVAIKQRASTAKVGNVIEYNGWHFTIDQIQKHDDGLVTFWNYEVGAIFRGKPSSLVKFIF